MSRKDRIVLRLSKGIETYLFKKNKITLFKGQGRLEGAKAVVVKGEARRDEGRHEERRSSPRARGRRRCPGITPDGKTILTSDDILQLKEIPKSLIVIGAGAVGIEFASMFARFGSTVTVIEMLPRILPLDDEEISAEAHKVLAQADDDPHRGQDRGRAQDRRAASRSASATPQGESKTVTAEVLLLAVGRGPVTDGLNLESTKVQLDRGYVKTEPPAWRPTSRASSRSATWSRCPTGRTRSSPTWPPPRASASRSGWPATRSSRSTTTASPRPPTAGRRRPASASPRPRRRSAATT